MKYNNYDSSETVDVLMYYRENDFAEVFKNLAEYRSEINFIKLIK